MTLKDKLSIRSIEYFSLVLEQQYSITKLLLLHEEELIQKVGLLHRHTHTHTHTHTKTPSSVLTHSNVHLQWSISCNFLFVYHMNVCLCLLSAFFVYIHYP